MKPSYLAFIILSSLTLLPGCKKEAKNGVASPQKAVKEVTPKDHGLEAQEDLRELNRLAQAGKVKAIAASVQTQFQYWAGGISRYKAVYGFYPNIGGKYVTTADTLHDLSDPTVNGKFVRALSGHQPTGTALSAADLRTLNRNAEEFVAFDREDFDRLAEFTDSSLLADKFGNKKIRVILDTDNDMVIRNVNSKDLPDEISAASTSAGIKARVIIYTKGENGAPDVVAIQQN
jgi:hypothetical protein